MESVCVLCAEREPNEKCEIEMCCVDKVFQYKFRQVRAKRRTQHPIYDEEVGREKLVDVNKKCWFQEKKNERRKKF